PRIETLSEAAPAAPAEMPPPPSEPIEAPRVSLPGPGPAEDTYDRRGPRRRDRDRRGKKPKIPSFESKSYEPRPDDRGFGSIEVLPGESLAKYSRRPETEQHAPVEVESTARHITEAEEGHPVPAPAVLETGS